MDYSRVVPYLNIFCAGGGVQNGINPKQFGTCTRNEKVGTMWRPRPGTKKCASAEDRTHDLRVHSATLYEVRHSLELRIINATRHIELASEHNYAWHVSSHSELSDVARQRSHISGGPLTRCLIEVVAVIWPWIRVRRRLIYKKKHVEPCVLWHRRCVSVLQRLPNARAASAVLGNVLPNGTRGNSDSWTTRTVTMHLL